MSRRYCYHLPFKLGVSSLCSQKLLSNGQDEEECGLLGPGVGGQLRPHESNP